MKDIATAVSFLPWERDWREEGVSMTCKRSAKLSCAHGSLANFCLTAA